MKTAGLIGGMSWESTAVYYRLMNEGVQKRLGGLHSAQILMLSLDFAKIESLQSEGRWAEAAQILIDSAKRLEDAGADFLALCTNTMRRLAENVAAAVNIPAYSHCRCRGRRNPIGRHGNHRSAGHPFYYGGRFL